MRFGAARIPTRRVRPRGARRALVRPSPGAASPAPPGASGGAPSSRALRADARGGTRPLRPARPASCGSRASTARRPPRPRRARPRTRLVAPRAGPARRPPAQPRRALNGSEPPRASHASEEQPAHPRWGRPAGSRGGNRRRGRPRGCGRNPPRRRCATRPRGTERERVAARGRRGGRATKSTVRSAIARVKGRTRGDATSSGPGSTSSNASARRSPASLTSGAGRRRPSLQKALAGQSGELVIETIQRRPCAAAMRAQRCVGSPGSRRYDAKHGVGGARRRSRAHRRGAYTRARATS